MKKKWKVLLIIGLVVVLAGVIFGSIAANQRGIVAVETGKVTKTELASVVTASGEVKPKNYINLGDNAAAAPIEAIYVKEGDHVHKGQVLARLLNTQPQADLEAEDAAYNSALADSTAAEAGVGSADQNIAVAQAQVDHDKADLEQKELDYKRAKELFDAKLLSSSDFESKKAAYDLTKANYEASVRKVDQAKAAKAQAAAQLSSTQKKAAQMRAMVNRSRDVLNQFEIIAPLDGVVTNLPMRVGETVVPGIQNAQGSVIMTIADMSVITAEVNVDETDIVNVKMDQPAEVTIDAIPNQTFKGHVIQIGDTAIVRSTGIAASQSQTSSQEAKDFRVVIALDIPQDLVRPGLSCTAKITTATRKDATAIPIQALTVRQKNQLLPPGKQQTDMKDGNQEIQGVFVVRNGKAEFQKVDTGITGATDIEVLNGIKPGDEIVTGSYEVIRTLRNDVKIKVEKPAPGVKS